MNAATIFMAVTEIPAGEDIYPAEQPGALVVTSAMKDAHAGAGAVVQHDMAPAFHPLVIPNWRDCLTCRICGYVLVTQAMYEQAPHWLKVYLAALYLEDWLLLVEEVPEAAP